MRESGGGGGLPGLGGSDTTGNGAVSGAGVVFPMVGGQSRSGVGLPGCGGKVLIASEFSVGRPRVGLVDAAGAGLFEVGSYVGLGSDVPKAEVESGVVGGVGVGYDGVRDGMPHLTIEDTEKLEFMTGAAT